MILLPILAALALIVFFLSTFVLLFGAPYVPTLAESRRNALDLLDLKPGQTLYELGSGDGSLLVEAAQRGLVAVGYELNPLLVAIARWRGHKYDGRVRVVWSNFWKADFAQADGIFVFQMDRSMKHLEAKINREATSPVKVASHAFKLPDVKPVRKKGAIFLYEFKPVA